MRHVDSPEAAILSVYILIIDKINTYILRFKQTSIFFKIISKIYNILFLDLAFLLMTCPISVEA